MKRRQGIDLDLRFSLLEIKRADQLDMLPGIGRDIFDDVGRYVVSDGLLLSIHSDKSRVL